MEQYLKTNHRKLDFHDHTFSDLALLDEDLAGKKIFLCGENHGVRINEKLRMRFLEYYKEKTDFKYYLWELPLSNAYFLNQYLETGNEKILKEVYEPFKNTYAWNKESFTHWQNLYAFNKKLLPRRKIKIVGIDIEHQAVNAFKYLIAVTENDKKKAPLARALKKFSAKGIFEEVEVKKFCQNLLQKLSDGPRDYGLKLVLENLLARFKAYGGPNFNDARDKQMYQNFQTIYKQLPPGKYFGQLGLSHVFLKKTPSINWFASLLNNNGFQDKVLSVAYVYDNCKYLYPTTLKDYEADITTLNKEAGHFRDFSESETILFKLNGENSPFNKEMHWPLEHRAPSGGVTTNYFQYLVLIKKAPAATPLPRS